MATSRTRRAQLGAANTRDGDPIRHRMDRATRALPKVFAGVAGIALIAAMAVLPESAAGATQSVTAPSSGAAGTSIVITGAGWPGFDSVAAYLEQGSTHTFFCSFSADAAGNLGPAVCALPTTLPQGAYSLVVTDNTLSANESFTLNPGARVAASSTGGAITSAARGQTLFLNGFGFKGGSTITSVKMGTTAVTTTPAKPATTTAGGFSGATFVVPSTLAAGESTVTVTDAASHAATLPLNVYAATDTSPGSGSAGKSLAVSGAGWPANDSVAAYLAPPAGSPTFFCSLGTDANGNLGPTLCTLPSLTQGSYTLLLTDNSVFVNVAFTLNPGVLVAASSSGGATTTAAAGQTVFLSGEGFAGSSNIASVKVGATAVTTVPATPATTATGAFSGVSFAIPKTAKAGLTPVTATDASSHSAVVHLTVFKATDTSAASGTAGKSLAVSGAGWPASDSAAAYLVSGAGTATFFCSVGTDTEGNLGPTLCTLPSGLTQGSYTLLLTDNSVSVTKPFTLNPGVVVSGTSSTSALTSAAAGQTVALSGVGFAGSSTIKSVKVGATAVTLTPAIPPTSGTGAFSGVTFAIPASAAAGTTTITVTDAASHSATWHLTVYKATDTSASSGNAGKSFVVSGSGWPLTESVSAYLVQGSTQQFFCSLSTDTAGNVGPAVCTLPSNLPQGSYSLLLTDSSVVVTKSFTLNPGVTLTNTSSQPIDSAARGSTVDFSGAGFVAGGTIKSVTIGTTKVTTSPTAPSLSAQGSFSGASFVVPSTIALGSNTVTITDSSGKKATAPLSIT